MNFIQFLNEVKESDDERLQSFAASYGVNFSLQEIQSLKPLLDEISLHWWFTGVPETFVAKVAAIVGDEKAADLLEMYEQVNNK